jgi:hypothetical protein
VANKTSSRPKAAQKSPGVHSTSVSKWNALEHGILLKAVVLQNDATGEKQEDLHLVLEELRNSLQPVGILEEIQVEFMATIYWRLGRALKSEAGLLDYHSGLRTLIEGLERLEERDANRHAMSIAMTKAAGSVHNRVLDDSWDSAKIETNALKGRQSSRNSSLGLQDLINALDGFISTVNEKGLLDEGEVGLLSAQFGSEDQFVARACGVVAEVTETKCGTGLEGTGTEAAKESLLAALMGLRQSLSARLDAVLMLEKSKVDALKRASLVPDEGAMDRILRNQTTLQREFYCAQQKLERLQRIRKLRRSPSSNKNA